MVSKHIVVACVALMGLAIVPDTSEFKKIKYDECELNCFVSNGKRVCPGLPDCENHVDPNW